MTAATAVAGCAVSGVHRSVCRRRRPGAEGARPSAVLRLHFHTVHGGGRDRHDAVQPAARPWPGPPVHVGAAGRHRDRRAAGSAGDLRFPGWPAGRGLGRRRGTPGHHAAGRLAGVRTPPAGALADPWRAAAGAGRDRQDRRARRPDRPGHAGGGDLRRVHLCRLWLQRDGRRHGHGPGAATGLFDVLRAARRDRADPGAEPGRGQLGPHPRDGPADREAGAGLRPGHGRAAGAAGPVHRGPVQGHRPRPRSGGVLLSLRQFHLGAEQLFFVAVAVFNNLGHAGYSTAISWLRATVGTLPLVWLGARLGGPEGVVLGQSASFALFSLVALALCRRVLRRPPPRPAAAAAGRATGG